MAALRSSSTSASESPRSHRSEFHADLLHPEHPQSLYLGEIVLTKMGEKRDNEQEPLLNPKAAQAFTKHSPVAVCSEAPKQWDGGLLNCCGTCDLPGCATFGLVQTCPCFAWG